MWKKRLAVMASLVLVVGTISLVAYAQEAGGDDGAGKVHRHGVGALWARGTGSADLDVRHARVAIRLIGDITITGPADLDVRIDGGARMAGDDGQTVIVLTDFDGTIGIHGEDFTVDADGEIAIHGRGSGSFTLVGDGWWKTLHRRGHWIGVALELSD